MKSRQFDRALNLIVILGLAVFAFRPEGSVSQPILRWWDARKSERLLAEVWPEVVDSRIRMGGTPEGPTLVVLTDYQCPFCRTMATVIDSAIAANPSTGVIQLNFPLESIHPRAHEAARVAVCLEASGSLRERQRELYRAYGGDSPPELATLLPDLTGDPDALLACVESEETYGRVSRDVDLGLRLGLTGTPGFAVLGWGVHQGTTDVRTLSSWLRVAP